MSWNDGIKSRLAAALFMVTAITIYIITMHAKDSAIDDALIESVHPLNDNLKIQLKELYTLGYCAGVNIQERKLYMQHMGITLDILDCGKEYVLVLNDGDANMVLMVK